MPFFKLKGEEKPATHFTIYLHSRTCVVKIRLCRCCQLPHSYPAQLNCEGKSLSVWPASAGDKTEPYVRDEMNVQLRKQVNRKNICPIQTSWFVCFLRRTLDVEGFWK